MGCSGWCSGSWWRGRDCVSLARFTCFLRRTSACVASKTTPTPRLGGSRKGCKFTHIGRQTTSRILPCRPCLPFIITLLIRAVPATQRATSSPGTDRQHKFKSECGFSRFSNTYLSSTDRQHRLRLFPYEKFDRTFRIEPASNPHGSPPSPTPLWLLLPLVRSA